MLRILAAAVMLLTTACTQVPAPEKQAGARGGPPQVLQPAPLPPSDHAGF